MRQNEEGFSLVEMLVVVLIIAVLMAIALPIFLSAQVRSKDRSAQTSLRNALTTAKTLATDQQGDFLSQSGAVLTARDMTAAEGSLSFAAAGAVKVVGVRVSSPSGDLILLTTQSGAGSWFGVEATFDGRVSYCRGAAEPTNLGTTASPGCISGW